MPATIRRPTGADGAAPVRRSGVTSVPLFRFSGGRLSDDPSRHALPDALTRRQLSGVTAP
jgi:hypothetical protein